MIAIDIPMPESCGRCPFAESVKASFTCKLFNCSLKNWIHNADVSFKPGWCPLQEVKHLKCAHFIDEKEKDMLPLDKEKRNDFYKYVIASQFNYEMTDTINKTDGFIKEKNVDFPGIEKEISADFYIIMPQKSHSEQGS